MTISLFAFIVSEICIADQEGLLMEPTILNLSFDAVEWRFTSQGKYLLIKDPRALYQVYHPWDISRDGDFAMLSAQVTAPGDWQKPIFLNLIVERAACSFKL